MWTNILGWPATHAIERIKEIDIKFLVPGEKHGKSTIIHIRIIVIINNFVLWYSRLQHAAQDLKIT